MIRFLFYYFFIILYRGSRFFVRLLGVVFPFLRRACPAVTGDTNFLPTPLITLNKMMSDSVLPAYTHYVDVGCGEGLAGCFMRLFKGKTVILHDVQQHFLKLIQCLSRFLFISKVSVQSLYHDRYPDASVFFCAWTSWSLFNREKTIEAIAKVFPKGAAVVSVTYPVNHPVFVLATKTHHKFAWGKSTVYYYYHA